MSKTKKRRANSSAAVKRRAKEAALVEQKEQDKKRLKPPARSLLIVNLIFLAVSQLLYTTEMISEGLATFAAIIGLILMVIALYIQFGKPTNKTPRLK